MLRSPVGGQAQPQSPTKVGKVPTTDAGDTAPFAWLGHHLEALTRAEPSGKVDEVDKAAQTTPPPNLRGVSKKDALEPDLKISAAKRRQPGNIDAPTAKRRNVASASKGASQNPTDQSTRVNGEDWQQVTARKKKDLALQARRGKLDAIVIAAIGKLHYADMLRKVKGEPKLKQLSEVVHKIRRTQKGDLLLRLDKNGEKTDELKNAVSFLLGDQAAVRSLKQRGSVERRDIDEITSREDICEAIKCQYVLTNAEVVSLRKAYDSTQMAIISLPREDANKLLAGGKLRVGWMVCRLREHRTPVKCYRCLKYGHISKQCEGTCDRSKVCRRCGEEGHMAKVCSNDRLCFSCKGIPNADGKHVAGSSKYPLFKRVLAARGRK
ncbi:uncharacterized protein LOC119632069 [Glossina fuscipes]|uniref:Uncharacterized protein LOC119632069 n=1 Tax=Glossina fuscipes TaxID=7396 RepID=A0A8U0W6I4_9MUSC|nr:uncharacterized protein LOC119632069 [Glossina fuscipes]